MLSIIVFSVLTAGAPAWAHITPDKAKAIKAELTQGSLRVTAPDTTTSEGLPACAEQEEIDPAFVFAGGSRQALGHDQQE